jgi:SsrA-binding protein
MSDAAVKTLSTNRRARHEYHFIETLECGMELKGTEVKSMRSGRFAFADSYGWVENDQLWLLGFRISPYDFGNRNNHDPDRRKRLLVHKKELLKLKRRVVEKGLTLVPVRVYLNKKGRVKLELAVARGKKLYDKRADIKSRDLKRDADREIHGRD